MSMLSGSDQRARLLTQRFHRRDDAEDSDYG